MLGGERKVRNREQAPEAISALGKVMEIVFTKRKFTPKLVILSRTITYYMTPADIFAWIRILGIEKGFFFSRWFWKIPTEVRLAIIDILSRDDYWNKYTFQYALEDILGEKYTIVIDENLVPDNLKELYTKVLSCIDTLGSCKEKLKNEIEAIVHFLSPLKKEKCNLFVSVESFLNDLILSLFPQKRQRIKGRHRAEKAYKMLLYNIQLDLIEQEISYMSSVSGWLSQILVLINDENLQGFKIKLSIAGNKECSRCKALSSKGTIPLEEMPLLPPHIGCTCQIIPIFR